MPIPVVGLWEHQTTKIGFAARSVVEQVSSEVKTAPNKRRIDRRWLMIGGIVILVVAVAVTLFLARTGGSKGSDLSQLPRPAQNRPSKVADVFVADCDGSPPTALPTSLNITCGDGSVFFDGIVWSVWDADSAIGSGNLHANNCKPNCAEGKVQTEQATVILSQPVPGTATTKTTFTQLAVTPVPPNAYGLAPIAHSIPL